jgi:hypothetical protein
MMAVIWLAWSISVHAAHGAGASAMFSPLAPYTAFSWQAPWLGGTPHLSPLIWMSTQSMPGIIARKLAALPPGRRVLFVWHAQEQIWGDRNDSVPATPADIASGVVPAGTIFQSPWLDHGAAVRAAWFGRWLNGVKKSGTAVDFLVTDVERGLPMWVVHPPQVRAIGADPRFAALAEKFSIHDLAAVGNIGRWDVCSAWNAGMDSTIHGYFRSAYFAPLTKVFPGVGYSDYNSMILAAALADRARDLNGWAQPCLEPLPGTHQSPAIYGQIRQLANAGRNDGTNPDFTKDPLATIAWEAGTMRALVLGSSHPILPWFCPRSWRGDAAGTTPLAGTPYWEEMIYHAMLSGGCVDCLFWDPSAPPADVMAMNQVLATLQARTHGSASLKPLTTDAIPFNTPVIVSGAACDDGRRLFRVTVMPTATSATFKLPGDSSARTISIPAGQAGVWLSDDAK